MKLLITLRKEDGRDEPFFSMTRIFAIQVVQRKGGFIQKRIERIPWIRPIIDEQPDKDWYVWDKPLKRKNHRVHIYSTKRKYLVVLDLRGEDRVVFWTAFPIDPDNHHQEKKLLKEYSLYKLF